MDADAFQSTHPAWGGTNELCTDVIVHAISIHPSRVGWDTHDFQSCAKPQISIHLPRVGWDLQIGSFAFMPRAFQSTHPAWGETRTDCRLHGGDLISIHPPRVGWDPMLVYCARTVVFQSTHPAWGGTLPLPQPKIPARFQSTHPAWGGTDIVHWWLPPVYISIHPPLVGWDIVKVPRHVKQSTFQSTTPRGVGQQK